MISLLYRLADRARDRARRGQWNADLASGRRGEDLAHRFLRKLGFTVIARNYRPHSGGGEIDIVAREKEQLVFVEVKTRATGESERLTVPSMPKSKRTLGAPRVNSRDVPASSGTSCGSIL
jgi:hypothetical protein